MQDVRSANSRLIKALLPARLVARMDDVIAASGAYGDRSEFITDAIAGHLAELHAHGIFGSGSKVEWSDAARTGRVQVQRFPEPRAVIAVIPPVPAGTPTLDHSGVPVREPTWGMHNRDFPTLWALTHLIRTTQLSSKPVLFSDWVPDVVSDAWELGRRLPGDRFDVSGFPTNQAKRDTSEGRFVKFFIGDGAGAGPLFDMGLAGADEEDRVAATPAGLALLSEIEGFSCERGRVIPPEWTEAYLRHLKLYAPADLAFMSEILHRIRSGHDDRTSLVEATAHEHPDWSPSVVDTNVAGFVARAREWGLLLPRQRKGRYVLEDEAVAVLEEVTEA